LGNEDTWIDEMKYKTLILASMTMMAFSHNGWTAMDDGDAEATIRLMDTAEAESSDDVTREITLPDHLLNAEDADQVAAVEKAEKGLKNATDNVNKHTDNASQQGQDARERGQEMSEKANENRENRGRSKERPDPPGRPDNPGGR
jgi:hypothetical protein